ncbi:hypothetical protein J0S82_008287 [Galemys pyrenaicus]|uniref:Uncharacterized protein n=1 Tax=Galemys pyrenaicus TaxID=202257 RepID=A0A8J5ZMU5_GALPY|nr:hypothetical protein J0S82_008287 [Galemys pyrenaicus]
MKMAPKSRKSLPLPKPKSK